MRLVFLRALQLLAVALVPLALAGCGTLTPRQVPSNAFAAERAVVPGIPGARIWGDEVPNLTNIDVRFPALRRLAQSAQIVDGRPQVYILALSGGGS
ncbi:MAG: patatin, partial [Proteobacteria bacterium]|nr:patatin [Pseudomonadota bacterium]